MHRQALGDIRDHIETLATESGDYYLVCARYGDRPVPAQGFRFTDRPTARAAARATEQYRAALRHYDPTLPRYDIVACQDHRQEWDWPEADGREASAAAPPTEADQRLVAFCHRTAAAVYESLVGASHAAAADAVMASYYEMAETRGPDDLCLALLERMTEELSARLSPAEQADVLSDAAGAVGPCSEATDPVTAALSDLRGCGLVGGVTRSGWSVDEEGRRSVEFRLSEYALSPRDDHLSVLPIVVDLFRRGLERPPTESWVVHTDEGWEFTLVFAPDEDPDGLTNAPIRPASSS